MSFPTTAVAWIGYVRDFIGTDEYTDAQVGTFLDLAQNRLNREMMSYGMEAMSPVAITAGHVTVGNIDILTAIPKFEKIRLVHIQGTTIGPLHVLSLNEMKKMQAQNDNPGGESTHYMIDAGKLYIYPFPAEGAIVEVYFYEKQLLLATTVTESNVFSLKYPDALLHAACLEAAPYMVEDERIPVWENKYVVALSTANDESNKIKLGSTPLQRRFRTG